MLLAPYSTASLSSHTTSMLALVLGTAAFTGPTRPPALARPAALASRSAVTRMCEEPSPLELATKMCDNFVEMCERGGATPPTALATLKEAIREGDLPAVRAAQYELLIQQTLEYDLDEEKQSVTAASIDYSKTDDEAVVAKMKYLYTYGIKVRCGHISDTFIASALTDRAWPRSAQMFMSDMLTQEQLQQIVLDKLASRVGMDGQAFDKWLEVPAVV